MERRVPAMKHPISKEVLDRFVLGQATPEERRAVGRHLLQGCPICAKILQAVICPGTQNEPRKPLGRMKRRTDETETRSASLQG
jgi:hypothetical protein